MKHYSFGPKDYVNGALITVIALTAATILYLIGISMSVFNPVGRALNDFHLSDGFFYAESLSSKPVSGSNPEVVIVDIKDCDSRGEIASLINIINDSEPELLVVDIIFGRAASMEAESDSALVGALKRTKKLVIASRIVDDESGGHIERSFFADDIDCVEGDVGFDTGTVRSFTPGRYFEGEMYPSIVAQIADFGNLSKVVKPQIINYTPVTTIRLTPDILTKTELLKNKIVLLGDTGDYRDFHDIPVLIDGKSRASGTIILAQCLYTLNSGNEFKSLPIWLSFAIGLILTYLFCTFFASPLFRIERFNGFWISLAQIVAIIITLFIVYSVFWAWHVDINLTYWLVGIGFSGFATEFYYFIPELVSDIKMICKKKP